MECSEWNENSSPNTGYVDFFRLDVSFNRLETFKFSIFDQVGSATALKVNASYNRITSLTDSNAPTFFSSNFYPPPKPQSKYILLYLISPIILSLC